MKKKRYALNRDFSEFGSYLREKRKGVDLTQREVADKLGYSSAQFVSNFERGLSLPPLSKLKLMFRLYKVPKSEAVQVVIEAKTKFLNKYL